MPAATVEWRSVDDLLTCFHPNNPVAHDKDIPDLAASLLQAGWVEPICLNQRNALIVGGHGRVMAADWLRQQNPEWFGHQFELWQVNHEATPSDRERFSPDYWMQALVLLVDLSKSEHEAMLIRLNDTESQGKDDPQRLKALLNDLPGRLRQLAGYTPEPQTKSATHNSSIAEMSETDFQDKQVFDRPDATDYRVRNAPEPNTAEHFSGDVTEYQDDDEIDPAMVEEEEESEPEPPKAPPPVRALSISLTWAQWKQWNAWKRDRQISKDTDAFVAGHAAYKEKLES
jgi:hypothetical protein